MRTKTLGSRKRRPEIGDVVLIPVDKSRSGIAQVVGKYKSTALFLSVFDRLVGPGTGQVEVNADDSVLLLALTFDAKIWNGDWTFVGNSPVLPGHDPLPAYIVGISPPGAFVLEDYAGFRRRPATQEECLRFRPRTLVSPIVVEKALKAYHGVDEWEKRFDQLRIVPESNRSDVVFGTTR